MSKIARMIDYAPVRCGDHDDLIRWLKAWTETLESDLSVKSLAVVVETEDGQLGLISQSTGDLDRARLVGMVQMAINQRADGGAHIEDLLEDEE